MIYKDNINFGHSSKLIYDKDTYEDMLHESVQPGNYKLSSNYIYNCNQCFTDSGPRAKLMGNSVSTTVGHPAATSQHLTDIDSILSNRNMKLSRSRQGQVNNIDISKYELHHLPSCNNNLEPMSSKLTLPTQNFRSMAINRFYDLERNPQDVIFWDSATNTTLEAKDNFVFGYDKPWKSDDYPNPLKGKIDNVINLKPNNYC